LWFCNNHKKKQEQKGPQCWWKRLTVTLDIEDAEIKVRFFGGDLYFEAAGAFCVV
jgi:hypothetical protein